MILSRMGPDPQWAAAQVAGFPLSWQRQLIAAWAVENAADRSKGNSALRDRCAAIESAHRVGIEPGASDGDIVQRAKDAARECSRRIVLAVGKLRTAAPMAVQSASLWTVQDWLEAQGLGDAWARLAKRASARAVLLRAQCERWWRRLLRAIQARAIEGTARAIGLVHKRAGCYVSEDGARRRRGQIARNAAALESVTAINDKGQKYTLAELAAKGSANREIRRHELMTRIAGFELIARECNHAAYFLTVTCPSRMHAYRTKPGGYGVEANPKHDGTKPDEAQRFLSKQWARFRAAADRAGLQLYGFRIAEPNHDGTPHWHCLLFFPNVGGFGKRLVEAVRQSRCEGHGDRGLDGSRAAVGAVPLGGGAEIDAATVAVHLLRRYFLWQVDPHEVGALRHRVKVVKINWAEGSAAGYIAKYVAKNIDGNHVGKDLYGNDAFESSQRVEAWAAAWRIRQFQQIGGAPVTVWRELRRLHPEQATAAPVVALALEAVNITAGAKDHASEAVRSYTAAHGWATYLHLQGGWRVKRAAQRLHLLREQSGELGRYGEPMAPKPVGVVVGSVVIERREAFGIVPAHDARRYIVSEVESERSEWVIVPKGCEAAALGFLPGGEAVRPWSPVNNCTRSAITPAAPLFRQSIERTRKRGRWANWDRGRATNEAKNGPNEPNPASDRR